MDSNEATVFERYAATRQQDELFVARMRRAIERGHECAPTAISTAPGTGNPVSGFAVFY